MGLRGGTLGEHGSGEAEELIQGSEIPRPAEQGPVGLWGRAWCAALAILLVYSGVEKPCTR
jgi:hypothetical protein